MLLRSSRAAGRLTKCAFLGTAARAGAKGLKFMGKHWKGFGGAGLVGLTAVPAISQGVKGSEAGLSKPWLQAASAGAVPNVPKIQ